MSILRMACSPADVPSDGYDFTSTVGYDDTRASGAFRLIAGQLFRVNFTAHEGDVTWVHAAFAYGVYSSSYTTDLITVKAADGEAVGGLRMLNGALQAFARGNSRTNAAAGQTGTANSVYHVDIKIDRSVADTLTVRFYMNGGLINTLSVADTSRNTNPVAVEFGNGVNSATSYAYFSEILIADEDTRGMRVRELRPQALGIYQEWDGSVNSIRDNDLATGISTAIAEARVSFGVTNLDQIGDDISINRVVCQSYGQRGESGLTGFSHLFRFRDGTVAEGQTHTLAQLGDYFIEEFTENPSTTLAWEAADFKSLQTGLVSKA